METTVNTKVVERVDLKTYHKKKIFFKLKFFFFCLFAFSRATPAAYGGSQARGLIGAVAASLSQSHSNVGSKEKF